MAIYNSGSVNITIGSANVKGNSTNFSTYVSKGNLFKLNDDNGFYEVANVINATNLTLTSRYTDSNYQTARSENVASANTATKTYSDTLTNTPVIQNYVVITASERFTDNGAGVLTGNGSPVGSGTIDYDSGLFSITLGTNLTATVNLSASYYSGDTRNSMPYKIIKDFTPNYSLPELSLNDREFNTVFTKAMRKIDSALNTKVYDFSSLSEDHSYSGNVINATVGESVSIGNICQLASDNKFYKMDASSESTTKGLCVMSTESATADSSCAFLTYGLIRDDSWSWTSGAELYLSSTNDIFNEDFSTDNADVIETGWSHDAINSEYDCDGTQVVDAYLGWYNKVSTNTFYQVKFEIANWSAGKVQVKFGGDGDAGSFVSANGVYIQNISSGSSSSFYFYADSNFIGSVKNVTIKHILGSPTSTMPSATGEVVRIIGYAKSSNHIWFDPDKTYLEIGV